MDMLDSEFVTVVEVEERKTSDDFVTVVLIGKDGKKGAAEPHPPPSPPATAPAPAPAPAPAQVVEEVPVFRLPGERLGMALKFEGGACASQPIDRVFIQSINKQSPASRARGKAIGLLQEGDEILCIQGRPVSGMTRIHCVSGLRDERDASSVAGLRDAYVAVALTVRRVTDPKSACKGSQVTGKEAGACVSQSSGRKGPPPPIPPRLSSTTLSTLSTLLPPASLGNRKSASNRASVNSSCDESGKGVGARAGNKRCPPPLPPRRPKDPPPAAPVSRKVQPNCKASKQPVLDAVQPQTPVVEAPCLPSGPPAAPEVYTDTLCDKSVSDSSLAAVDNGNDSAAS